MDIILTDHSAPNLEAIFENHYLGSTELFSVMAEPTQIPWLQFIPKQPVDQPKYAGQLYQAIHQIAFDLQTQGYGHFNLAKIGNKLPYYHIHLIFRNEQDEAWPNPVWCQEPLTPSETTWQTLKQQLQPYLSEA